MSDCRHTCLDMDLGRCVSRIDAYVINLVVSERLEVTITTYTRIRVFDGQNLKHASLQLCAKSSEKAVYFNERALLRRRSAVVGMIEMLQ